MSWENSPRQATNSLLDLVDEGVLDARTVLQSALCYMSEAEVADLVHQEGFLVVEDDEDDEYPDYDELEYQEADLIPRKASSALCIYMQTH